jgi:hypothetical protein
MNSSMAYSYKTARCWRSETIEHRRFAMIQIADGRVRFRWRNSAHNNQKRIMPLPVDQFLRRFLLYLLPRGFMRIRNFGFLGTPAASGTSSILFPPPPAI